MKKFFLLLFVAIVSSVSTFAANANASASASTNDADLVIKQTIKFEDQSQPITIYYVKQNDVYQVYSETDLSKQSPSKLKKMDSTKVELAKTY